MKNVFIISGPSGAGKSTLINMLLNEFKDIATVVSHTTRAKRHSETNDLDYHFISRKQFQEMIDNEEFIEYVECFGNYYGTSITSINEALKNHKSCVMDLEWSGAFNILHKQKIIDLKLTGILILPPSIKTLKRRLNNRGTETPETLTRRVRESFIVDKIARYSYIIVNNNIDDAYKELRGIINGNH